ncbi:MAG: hypothetical protein OHK93_008077 [Ramalina farinacea]|uniref:Protein kinase domain-containing protein n=1 Tax=Ramalina farinacea TaxID=258253 RepID=A0AA43QPN5_9LECA|nr:hypothetical protein [Ramalina farinacea]
MEGPDLIATLIPSDDDDLARNAFRHEDNQKRCLPPTRGIDEGPATSSREATPACAQSIVDDYGTHEHKHRLRLTFNKEPPKDPTKGYAFGTDKQKCDVLLGSRGARGTSRVHFHITFDLIGGKRRLVLTDCSTHGTAVIYNGQAREEVRHHFTWILNLAKGEGEWKIVVHVRRLKFKVELASHETYKAEYNENVEKFLNHSRTADPPLGVLSINSYLTTVIPSQSLTPGQRPIYIHEEELGRGSFGRVDRVVNVSTGAIYAHKEFYEPKWEKDAEHRKHQQEKWRNQIRREIRIMMEHPYVSITTQVRGIDNNRCERNILFRS